MNSNHTYCFNSSLDFKKIPKLEFHGHFNGLITDQLLDKYIFSDENKKISRKDFTYEKFFNIVKGVSYSLIECPEFKSEAIQAIVEDYIEQKCVYLELRDTPKESIDSEKNITVYDYTMDLFKKVQEMQEKHKDKILIKFFLNLHKCKNKKELNIKILEAFKTLPDEIKKFIIGIDIGGQDFNFNYFEENKYIYQYFQTLGYKINFHLYEKEEEKYFKDIINFHPDRISQCVYLNKIEELDLLVRSKIPLEILPSFSINLTKSQRLAELENYVYLYKKGHPLLIGTDNRYILGTNLTQEYEKYYSFISEISEIEDHEENDLLSRINNIRTAFSNFNDPIDLNIIQQVEILIKNFTFY
jgi:adenosine deaminase